MIIGVGVYPGTVSKGHKCNSGVVAEFIEPGAHGTGMLSTRQSMGVAVKDHDDGAAALVFEAPFIPIERWKHDVGCLGPDARASEGRLGRSWSHVLADRGLSPDAAEGGDPPTLLPGWPAPRVEAASLSWTRASAAIAATARAIAVKSSALR